MAAASSVLVHGGGQRVVGASNTGYPRFDFYVAYYTTIVVYLQYSFLSEHLEGRGQRTFGISSWARPVPPPYFVPRGIEVGRAEVSPQPLWDI